jgi:hypothetical protein
VSFQRQFYKFTHVKPSADSSSGSVVLSVDYAEGVESRSDCLLLVACAWIDSMRAEGLNPLECLIQMLAEMDAQIPAGESVH